MTRLSNSLVKFLAALAFVIVVGTASRTLDGAEPAARPVTVAVASTTTGKPSPATGRKTVPVSTTAKGPLTTRPRDPVGPSAGGLRGNVPTPTTGGRNAPAKADTGVCEDAGWKTFIANYKGK